MKKIIISLSLIFAICLLTNCRLDLDKALIKPATIKVDYAKSAADVITEAKDYCSAIDTAINPKNFPWPTEKIGRQETLSAQIVSFPFNEESSDIIEKMAREGYRPGTLVELIAFIAQCPAARGKNIVALGSVKTLRGYPQVPCLRYNRYNSRYCLRTELLNFPWLGRGWRPQKDWIYFLAIAKS